MRCKKCGGKMEHLSYSFGDVIECRGCGYGHETLLSDNDTPLEDMIDRFMEVCKYREESSKREDFCHYIDDGEIDPEKLPVCEYANCPVLSKEDEDNGK